MTHKIRFLMLTAAAMLAAPLSVALAQDGPEPAFIKTTPDSRDTLFAPFGEITLMFEAPLGMCFLDGSRFTGAKILDQMQHAASRDGQKTLVAYFASCEDIALMDGGGTPDPEKQKTSGTITWLNPFIGEKTKMSRADYLDMREAGFKSEAAAQIEAIQKQRSHDNDNAAVRLPQAGLEFIFDTLVRRTQQGAGIGYIAKPEKPAYDDNRVKAGVVTTTLIRQRPVEFSIALTGEKDEAGSVVLQRVRTLMDKFVEQQIALNE